ncbi:cytochrome c maturation protein CcmE [Lacibacterium aquatile]|uniref:Cytochrome c-type biogenesis protein CcmE n=1 Tax=Lacibacterium aquatile TaxID=1168082 RepID=A0ABW5DYD2_9PROT
MRSRKQRRLYVLLLGLGALGVATALILAAFSDNLVFFHTPSDIAAGKVKLERTFRLGGLVETGSVVKAADGLSVTFRVTDGGSTLPVSYKGVLPDLFREGQGVVALGRLNEGSSFVATEILAKHDENYMPKELTDAIKKQGQWKEGTQK